MERLAFHSNHNSHRARCFFDAHELFAGLHVVTYASLMSMRAKSNTIDIGEPYVSASNSSTIDIGEPYVSARNSSSIGELYACVRHSKNIASTLSKAASLMCVIFEQSQETQPHLDLLQYFLEKWWMQHM